MCISTAEIAFFGFSSTWLYSVCMLLAVITDTPWCISNMLYLNAGDWIHLLLCVLPNLSHPCARMRAYGLLDRCLDKHRELEDIPRTLTGAQCTEDHAEVMAKRLGGTEGGSGAVVEIGDRQTDGTGGAEVFKLEN